MTLNFVTFVVLAILLAAQLASTQVVIKDSAKDGIEVIDRDPNKGTQEIFTSMYDLENFFKKEKDYIEDIRAIIEKKLVTPSSATSLRDYISSFEDVLGDQDDDASFVQNPLNVYLLIRHVAIGWSIVNNTLYEERGRVGGNIANLPKRVRRVLNRPKRDHIPGEVDLDGAAVAIVRLHDYYKFDVERFVSEGVFETDQFEAYSNGDLTVWDAFKIGVKGANKMFLGSGLQIMMAALVKAQREGVSTPPFIQPMDISVLKNLVKTARTVHDQKLDRWGARTMTHSTNEVPYDKRLAKKKKFNKNTPFKVILNDSKIVGSGTEKEQYIKLCRGIELRPASVTKNLYCYYGDRNKPHYRYGPRKVEVVSLEPRIVVLHEFITNSEANQLIELAGPRIRRSEVIGKNNDTLDDNRISEQTWAIESESEAAARLTKRIDDFLNMESLSQDHAELYQVANYGLGGLYTVHYDQVLMGADPKSREARQVFNIVAGDRITTIMGYLTDVAAGGYTVFPLIGAYVPPRKGSVVMWWNMDQAGGYDDMTRHGGCPVMIGNKWITNKWVRANSQMFKRPCPLQTGREIRDVRSKNKLRKGPRFADP